MAQDSMLKSECNFGKSICEIQLTLLVKLNDKRLFMRKKEKIIIADLVFTLYNTESVKNSTKYANPVYNLAPQQF